MLVDGEEHKNNGLEAQLSINSVYRGSLVLLLRKTGDIQGLNVIQNQTSRLSSFAPKTKRHSVANTSRLHGNGNEEALVKRITSC